MQQPTCTGPSAQPPVSCTPSNNVLGVLACRMGKGQEVMLPHWGGGFNISGISSTARTRAIPLGYMWLV